MGVSASGVGANDIGWMLGRRTVQIHQGNYAAPTSTLSSPPGCSACPPHQHLHGRLWLARQPPARAGPSCCNALPCCYVVHCLSSCLQLTIFKRVCRKLGLQRWPYEKPCKADGERTPGGARAGGTPRGSGSWHLPPVSQAWAGGARAGNHAAAPGGSRASSGQASGQELATAAAQVGDACCCSVGGHRANRTLVGQLFQAALLPRLPSLSAACRHACHADGGRPPAPGQAGAHCGHPAPGGDPGQGL